MKKGLIALIVLFAAIAMIGQSVYADELTPEQIEKKKEGFYVTGLPLINFSSDTGVGYGARVYLYNNGKRDNPAFPNTPYLTQIYLQFFQTTLGRSYHEAHWDQFNLFGTKLRIKAFVAWDTNISKNYFGYGSDTTRYNLLDGNYQTHKTYSHYEENFMKQDLAQYFGNFNPIYYATGFMQGIAGWGGMRQNMRYHKYRYQKPTFSLDLFGPIVKYVDFLFGVQAAWMGITRYDGYKYSVNGNQYYQWNPTKLNIERPVGYKGGWTNFVRAGIAFKNIDFEPDPTKGVHIDYCIEMSQKWIGSDYTYWRHTFGARGYYTFLKLGEYERITLAGRLAYMTASRDIPFFELNTFAFPWNRQTGLGGNRTLRGYKESRFVAKTMTLANAEIRINLGDRVLFKTQRFGAKLVGFFDAGNAYDKAHHVVTKPRWDDYKYNYGGGLLITWNQATVIHFYYAASPEDSAISIDFGHSIQ